MMKRRFLLILLGATLLAGMPGSTPGSVGAQDQFTIRIATLAPRGSSWMRVFDAWNRTLRNDTEGRLRLRFYPGGIAGDERDVIRKMGSGQMDAAAVTSTGLGQVVRPILVLQVPGLFSDYDKIDHVRAELNDDFDRQFEQNGYVNLGWGDVGKARLFSNQPIRQPRDLRSVRPWAWRDDAIFSEFLRVVGANGVRLGVPEVYPALQTHMIDTFTSSALAAVSLQWYTRATHVTQQSDSVLIGALIMKKDKFDALPEDLQTTLRETSRRAHATLSRNVRRDDDRAYQTITSRGITPVDLTPHRAEWERDAAQVRNRLAGRLYPRALLRRVEAAAREGG